MGIVFEIRREFHWHCRGAARGVTKQEVRPTPVGGGWEGASGVEMGNVQWL